MGKEDFPQIQDVENIGAFAQWVRANVPERLSEEELAAFGLSGAPTEGSLDAELAAYTNQLLALYQQALRHELPAVPDNLEQQEFREGVFEADFQAKKAKIVFVDWLTQAYNIRLACDATLRQRQAATTTQKVREALAYRLYNKLFDFLDNQVKSVNQNRDRIFEAGSRIHKRLIPDPEKTDLTPEQVAGIISSFMHEWQRGNDTAEDLFRRLQRKYSPQGLASAEANPRSSAAISFAEAMERLFPGPEQEEEDAQPVQHSPAKQEAERITERRKARGKSERQVAMELILQRVSINESDHDRLNLISNLTSIFNTPHLSSDNIHYPGGWPEVLQKLTGAIASQLQTETNPNVLYQYLSLLRNIQDKLHSLHRDALAIQSSPAEASQAGMLSTLMSSLSVQRTATAEADRTSLLQAVIRAQEILHHASQVTLALYEKLGGYQPQSPAPVAQVPSSSQAQSKIRELQFQLRSARQEIETLKQRKATVDTGVGENLVREPVRLDHAMMTEPPATQEIGIDAPPLPEESQALRILELNRRLAEHEATIQSLQQDIAEKGEVEREEAPTHSATSRSFVSPATTREVKTQTEPPAHSDDESPQLQAKLEKAGQQITEYQRMLAEYKEQAEAHSRLREQHFALRGDELMGQAEQQRQEALDKQREIEQLRNQLLTLHSQLDVSALQHQREKQHLGSESAKQEEASVRSTEELRARINALDQQLALVNADNQRLQQQALAARDQPQHQQSSSGGTSTAHPVTFSARSSSFSPQPHQARSIADVHTPPGTTSFLTNNSPDVSPQPPTPPHQIADVDNVAFFKKIHGEACAVPQQTTQQLAVQFHDSAPAVNVGRYTVYPAGVPPKGDAKPSHYPHYEATVRQSENAPPELETQCNDDEDDSLAASFQAIIFACSEGGSVSIDALGQNYQNRKTLDGWLQRAKDDIKEALINKFKGVSVNFTNPNCKLDPEVSAPGLRR